MSAAVLALALAATAPSGAGDSGLTLRRFALLVGDNDGGAGRPLLHYADSDAEAMDRVLRQLGGVAEADRLLVLDPDRAGFLAAVGMLQTQLQQARAPGLRIELIVYYSGHSDESGLLLRGERLSYRELREALDGLAADVRIAILDSCASGELTRLKGGVQRPAFLSDSANQAKGHAFLTSSSADEVAQESDRLGSSFFTNALISGLRGGADLVGDGRVTLTEAYQFAFQETLARTERTRGGAQHPAYEIDLAGSGDVVMTDLRSTSALLQLARELGGRLFIRDGAGHLVVELAKSAGRPLQLALEPGLYQVTLDREGALLGASLTLIEGRAVALGASDLAAVAGEPTTSRGDAAAAIPEPLPERRVGLNLSLWPGFDSNGEGRVTDTVAFGFVSGADRLDGIAVSFPGNWIRDESRGMAFGLFNYAGVLRGGQGGWVNVEGGADTGKDGYGAQLGMVVNVAGGTFSGLQWSGVVNDASVLRGAQLGLINIAGDVRGTQLGLVNVAGEVKGLQLGLLNVAADSQAAIGLLSFGGQLHLDVWTGDTAAVNVGVEFGSRHLYTLIAVGYDPTSEVKTYDYLGFGLHVSFADRFWFKSDLGGGSTFATVSLVPPPQVLVKWRFSVGYSFASHFSIFAGVALNLLAQLPGDTLPDIGYGLEASGTVGQTQLHFWPGPYLGIGI